MKDILKLKTAAGCADGSHSMLKIPWILFFSLVCLCAPVFCGEASAASLLLSKSLPHYAAEMEFYYQKPRPEMLQGLMRALNDSGALAKGETRLMTAAFLAELAKNNLDLERLWPGDGAKWRDLRGTLAWSARLAQSPREKEFLQYLRNHSDAILAGQIAASPAPLSRWNVLSEKSVPQMFWGAFMAGGDAAWLDRIIEAALFQARAAERGAGNGPAARVGAAAAASLYELAPRHPLAVKRLKAALRGKSAAEKRMLGIILEHAR